MAGLEIGTSTAVAKAAIEVISKAHKQGWFDKLTSALRKKHRVLVLGATGAGKTAFLESLTETIPKAIESMNRTCSTKNTGSKSRRTYSSSLILRVIGCIRRNGWKQSER